MFWCEVNVVIWMVNGLLGDLVGVVCGVGCGLGVGFGVGFGVVSWGVGFMVVCVGGVVVGDGDVVGVGCVCFVGGVVFVVVGVEVLGVGVGVGVGVEVVNGFVGVVVVGLVSLCSSIVISDLGVFICKGVDCLVCNVVCLGLGGLMWCMCIGVLVLFVRLSCIVVLGESLIRWLFVIGLCCLMCIRIVWLFLSEVILI